MKNEYIRWFAFYNDRLLLTREKDNFTIPCMPKLSEVGVNPIRTQYLGMLNDHPCFSVELSDQTVPEGMWLEPLRSLFGLLNEEEYAMAGTGLQIVNWDKTHQYCGQCGTVMKDKPDERAKYCPGCGLLNYPRISPAIIAAVVKDDSLLLALRTAPTLGGISFYSVLSGYVEPGETLEQCVHREMREEVGIEVKNIRYFGSQPWPFSGSLMVGFTAEYAGGDIVPDNIEVKEAGWFRADNLPRIPGKISLSRKLIDWFSQTYR
jgi:NAD+ diphosphatase